jgi:hypothetical protein
MVAGERVNARDANGAVMGERQSARRRASPGLAWAYAMLLLEALECLVVAEVEFFDRPRHPGFGALEIYFCVVTATLLGQVAGIILVLRGRYRLGGLVQIISSAIHVLKGEGFIGVIGGMRARAYASEAALKVAGDP